MRAYQQTDRYKDDRVYGVSSEARLLPMLQRCFARDLVHSPGRYSTFDFVGATCAVELKARRCKKDTYSETMIGANKIQKMMLLDEKRRCYCVFSFTDGDFFVEITPEIVKQSRLSSGGRCDRGQIERQMYRFIPVNLLSPLELPSDDK